MLFDITLLTLLCFFHPFPNPPSLTHLSFPLFNDKHNVSCVACEAGKYIADDMVDASNHLSAYDCESCVIGKYSSDPAKINFVISAVEESLVLQLEPSLVRLAYHAPMPDKVTAKILLLARIVELVAIIQHLEELVLLAARGRRPHLLRP